jgi:hypothetical protein
MTEEDRPERLYLHIGLPKSGSTYVQSVLGNNRGALTEQSYIYPFVRQEGMFYAAVEMAGSPERWGLERGQVEGTFEWLLRRGRRIGGTVVISHEIFGWADDDQVGRIKELVEDFEVHVVITVRDLARTLTAEWQERVKNGARFTFEEFAGRILDHLPTGATDAADFWPSQNLMVLLERWQALAPPERTHLVVTPPKGADPGVLWGRFADALSLAPGTIDRTEVPLRNESLGIGQIAFLRHVLEALGDRLQQPWHSRVAKRWFAQTLLSRAPSPRPMTPPEMVERLSRVSQSWIDQVRAGGYVVHGDLAELLPSVGEDTARHPDEATDADMLSGLPEVVAEMLLRTRDLMMDNERLDAEKAEILEREAALAGEVARLQEALEFQRRWWPARVAARLREYRASH